MKWKRMLVAWNDVADAEVVYENGYGRASGSFPTGRVSGRFISGLQRLHRFYKGVDEELWTALRDHTIVYAKGNVCFTFEAGFESYLSSFSLLKGNEDQRSY